MFLDFLSHSRCTRPQLLLIRHIPIVVAYVFLKLSLWTVTVSRSTLHVSCLLFISTSRFRWMCVCGSLSPLLLSPTPVLCISICLHLRILSVPCSLPLSPSISLFCFSCFVFLPHSLHASDVPVACVLLISVVFVVIVCTWFFLHWCSCSLICRFVCPLFLVSHLVCLACVYVVSVTKVHHTAQQHFDPSLSRAHGCKEKTRCAVHLHLWQFAVGGTLIKTDSVLQRADPMDFCLCSLLLRGASTG